MCRGYLNYPPSPIGAPLHLCPFLRRTTRNRFGPHMPFLASLFQVSLDGRKPDAKQLHNLGVFRGPSPRLAEHARVNLVSMPSWIPSWQKTAFAARRSDDPSGSRRLLLPEAFGVQGTSAICTSENSMALAKRVSSGDQAIA